MNVCNVHERRLGVPPAVAGAFIDRLAGPDDPLWPSDRWPPMRLDAPLAVGARGGHGPVRYRVAAYEPGRRLRFEFEPGPFSSGLVGYHEFAVLDDGPAGATLRHLIAARALGVKRLAWPLVIRPLHDALLEDLLDRAERAASGRATGSRGWSPWVRVLRGMLARRGRRKAG